MPWLKTSIFYHFYIVIVVEVGMCVLFLKDELQIILG